MTIKQTTPSPHCPLPPDDAERRFAFLSSRKLEVARMKRSEIRGIAFISRHFAALHTYMDPPLLSTISFDEKKAVAFVYPASRFKLATIGALMNYARLMLIGLSASQSPRMNQLNQPQVLPYFHQPSLFRTRLVCLLLLILFFTHGGV